MWCHAKTNKIQSFYPVERGIQPMEILAKICSKAEYDIASHQCDQSAQFNANVAQKLISEFVLRKLIRYLLQKPPLPRYCTYPYL